MLDTINCSIYTSVSLKGGKWIPHNIGLDNPFEWYWERVHNGITFNYYPFRYTQKRRTPLLCLVFSAATMQNGINVIPYSFDNARDAIKNISNTIEEVLGKRIRLQDIKHFSRVDINKNLKYRNDEEKNELFNFFGKFLCDKSQNKNEYETGCEYRNSSVKCLFYFKDKDENLGEELLKYMPKTARLEFQLHDYRIKKYYPIGLNLYSLLTNELATAKVWNAMLDEYYIGGKICNKQDLMKRASKLFKKNTRIRRRKMRQLRQINDTNNTTKHRAKTVEQMMDVVKELDSEGICPYSCEMELNLREDCIKILLKKRSVTRTFEYAYCLPNYNSILFLKSYFDSS